MQAEATKHGVDATVRRLHTSLASQHCIEQAGPLRLQAVAAKAEGGAEAADDDVSSRHSGHAVHRGRM